MQGSLGEKIGEGVSSDVHAWAPGQVVKLFKNGVPRRVAWEAQMTRVAFAAGLPAPEVFGEVTLEGRFGIVMSRFDGPTLLKLLRTGAVTSKQAAAIIASLAIAIHKTPPPPKVLSLRDWMDHSLRGSGNKIPEHIVKSILPLIDRLSPEDGLCHCDLHPDNVIMTSEGPRLIDWLGTVRAPPGLDLAVCHMLLAEIAPDLADDPERPRRLNAAIQSEYARLAGTSQAALAAAAARYLPIVSVFVLLGEWVGPAQRERLIQRLEAALRSED
jgi:tRNA A-37 threonylcarbamoyl transferase component Bud32